MGLLVEFLDTSYVRRKFSRQVIGTSIAFVGNTPHPNSSQSFTVSIDGSEGALMNYPEPGVNCQWYTSYTLDDASTHHIQASQLDKVSVDFAVITAGNNTPLTGKTIIVDDNSPEIQWSGQWQEQSNYTFPAGVDVSRPFGNGTHTSANVGDSTTFQFAGTAISVYGVFNWTLPGNINVAFTLDGNMDTRPFPSVDRPPNLSSSTNFLLFNAVGLSVGNHTIIVELAEVLGNQSLTLDYLTYQPSFSSLSDKPNFAAGSPSSTTVNSTPSQSATDSGAVRASSHSSAAIIGGVVGGTLLILMLLIYWFRRRRARYRLENHPEKAGSLITPNPLIFPHTSSHTTVQTVSAKGHKFTYFSNGLKAPTLAATSSPEASSEVAAHLNTMANLIAEPRSEDGSTPTSRSTSNDVDQIRELQERIEALRRENELLGGFAVPPPAYMQDPDDMTSRRITVKH
ncbi:hypothetical protein VKT23_000341 [Stygiomarasmius scandens]|uniref:Uncharacterized protein n=1 Tax=Marasmiellus scandens TaxID=2682957 RepID=A0ABR1K6H6_9AGAR